MKPNQTSKRGGIQDILIPMQYFRCLQGDFEGNHPYYACDMSGKDTGRDLFYAPVDVVCMSTNPSDGNAVWWQSQKKVRFADGTIDFLTIMIIHDNNLDGIYPGVKYSQGQQIAQEGTKGFTNGNHLHVEFAKGKYTRQYAKNAKGYYLPNGMAIENVCFSDGTTFLTSANWEWKTTSDVPPYNGFVKQVATFKSKVESIKIRKEPSLGGEDTGVRCKMNEEFAYDGYVKSDGYVWIHIRDDKWMAVRVIKTDQPYGIFY